MSIQAVLRKALLRQGAAPTTVVVGLSGSGKSRYLIERVNRERAAGRTVVTFVADDPWMTNRDETRVHRKICCHLEGIQCDLDHVVSVAECAALLAGLPSGALAAFDEANLFGGDIVAAWTMAAGRGVEIVIVHPSEEQLNALRARQGVAVIGLSVTCRLCGKEQAEICTVVPGKDETRVLCASCLHNVQEDARAEIRRRVEEQAPHPGTKAIYQPVALAECEDWNVLRPDSLRRAELMYKVWRLCGGLPGTVRPSYIDVGCNTGFFANYFFEHGFIAEGVDIVEGDIEVARLQTLLSSSQPNTTRFTVADCYEYLRDTQSQKFDLTSSFSVFQWLMIQRASAQHGVDCMNWLFEKARRMTFFEIGYSVEGHYRDQLGVNVDREWVKNIMVAHNDFSTLAVFDAAQHGLMRDLFVGIKGKRPNQRAWKALRAETFR